jgi:NAD-dependent SIR2 family protein deacetylase
VLKMNCTRCGKEWNHPMPELPSAGKFYLCGDCAKFFVSAYFLRLKARIASWFGEDQ